MRYLFVALLALFALPSFAAEPPLPEGAVARLGTTVFRTSGTTLCLSPDGTRAALRVTNGIDVLNLDTGEVVARMRDEKRLPDVIIGRESFRLTFAFAAGGKEVASSGAADGVHVWDAATGKFLRTIAGPKGTDGKIAGVAKVWNCQFADILIAETWAGWHKLDVKTGKWTAFSGGWQHISDVSPDGRWVTDYTDMASVENYVGVTDSKLSKSVYSGESGGAYPFNSTPSPDGKLVACTVSEACVQVWDIATKKEIKLKGVDPKVSHGDPRFAPDGKVLLVDLPSSPYDEKTPPHFARWDTTTGERLADWPLPAGIGSWAVDHKNNRLVMLAGQCVFRIDIATGKLAGPPDGFVGYARPALSPDGKFAAVGDAAGVLRVWEAPFTGKPRALRDAGSAVHDLQFSKDGTTLFVGFADRTATVCDLATSKETLLKPPAGSLKGPYYTHTMHVAPAPDGKTLLAVIDTVRLWAWDVASGKVLWESKADEKGEGITGCRPVFVPDGSAFYYGQSKAEVVKLDPRTGKELARFAVPVNLKSSVARLAVSPDGKRLAAHLYRNDGELVLFDIGKDAALWRQTFTINTAVGGLAFGADGATVVTTHGDGTVRGWKAADGADAFVLRGPAGYVERLQVTADGKFAITSAPGATALVWKLK